MLGSLLYRVKNKFARRGVVLMYHRIAKPLSDPWDLAVNPKHFEEHLKVLKAYNVISVDELADILTRKSKMPAKTVAVTFDDGYHDNYLAAKSLLEKYDIPASFFIPTDAIGKQTEFWWDALERICLQSPHLPDKLILGQQDEIWNIGKADNGNTLNPLDLYLKLCDMVRKMPSTQHQAFIESLEVWANNANKRPEYFTMDQKELLDLQSSPLFTIGAHTMTHPYLPYFSYEYQKNEIQGGINFLKELTGNSINYLAYPHGGHNQDTLAILPDSGIELAFTTHAQHFTTDTNKYAIPRFQIKNWDAATFAFHLNNWIKS
ncbi:polysaccharide deacetylase family protein [Pedobacter heparinus]|uniref:Polysaccharide deacetylase n=1 Tax=Pedobacter heparinus (strain ATCC 13125 / DSM 2366 / CIP 104194 / JCM 7457 / NBRC 12017 / NCIMB 9290 / NRRL B-14731 / HIM 762-3) TaxID=485917 RepID=C6XWT9_PEDHD|nr:polysaccharide deacetylase family protein [Pedobacter heparinus]ACU04233.1 polysaccharide deacetylase [Pedobacter heparinus DSM 2366]